MELLIQLGSNVNLLDSIITKFTPLDETARGGQARLAIYLLEHGALKSLTDTKYTRRDTDSHCSKARFLVIH